MNVFACTARLGKDAEVRKVGKSTLCQFSGAVDFGYGDRKGTLWIRFKLWGKVAEGNLPQYLTKGTVIDAYGELSQDSWEAQDGTKRTDLVVDVSKLNLSPLNKEQRTEPNQEERYPQDNTGGNLGTGEDVPFAPIF